MPGFQESPKNYKTLRAVAPQRGTPTTEVPHDRLVPGRWTGTIELRLEAIDPVRVGTGTIVPFASPQGKRELVHGIVSRGDLPVLPGSSVKGAIRSLVEALGGGCDPTGTNPCTPLCVACSMFGIVRTPSITWRGRVAFDDARPLRGNAKVTTAGFRLRTAFAPRKNDGRRVYGPKPEGLNGTELAWVAPPGSRWFVTLAVTNLSEAELGLLLLALGQDGTFVPRLGGGKYMGLGRTRFTLRSARLRQSYVGPPVELEGDALSAHATRWLAAAPRPTGQDAVLTTLREVMKP